MGAEFAYTYGRVSASGKMLDDFNPTDITMLDHLQVP